MDKPVKPDALSAKDESRNDRADSPAAVSNERIVQMAQAMMKRYPRIMAKLAE